jgi:hypothetical protein
MSKKFQGGFIPWFERNGRLVFDLLSDMWTESLTTKQIQEAYQRATGTKLSYGRIEECLIFLGLECHDRGDLPLVWTFPLIEKL